MAKYEASWNTNLGPWQDVSVKAGQLATKLDGFEATTKAGLMRFFKVDQNVCRKLIKDLKDHLDELKLA